MKLPLSRGKTRPERIRLALFEHWGRSTRIPLPSCRMWPAGIVVGITFVIFAGVAVSQIGQMKLQGIETVFDLMTFLFTGFWILGWSVGVLILFLLTMLFLFYRESAQVTDDRLVHVPQLGPLKVLMEYDLAKIRDLRLEKAGGGERARIRFDYGGGRVSLGNDMPRLHAESGMRTIRAGIEARARHEPTTAILAAEPEPAEPAPAPLPHVVSRAADEPPLTAPSVLALLGANLVPLVGVLFLGWDLGQVMVLFWAENAVIGFYNLLKLGYVAKWATVFVGPFFLGHFGGFMVGHFLFIYYLFVRGISTSGPEAPVLTTLGQIFVPLWPALLALFISHGVSFYANFVKGREYVGRKVADQMGQPYKRIIIMHVTIIFGGWAIMLLHTPVAALVLLVVLKTAFDLRAHRREHAV